MCFEKNISLIKESFKEFSTQESIFKVILDLGSRLENTPFSEFEETDRVIGCQSRMYVKSFFEDGSIYFKIYSDALISKGLAALLLKAYNGLSPEEILKSSPSFLTELHILTSLSLSRSNGVMSLFTEMQKLSLKHLISNKN